MRHHIQLSAAPKSAVGFVTACHAGDKAFVGATLASIRYYCPEAPICLIVDGDVDVTDLNEQYRPFILRVSELPCAQMRKLISGNFRTKLAAMWAGPFERYVWLDSDAIVWGDIRPFIDPTIDFQIFWERDDYSKMDQVPRWLRHYYLNPELIARHDPSFDWRRGIYFSAGTYACRRNAITFDEWMAIEDWSISTPGIFSDFGDMGPLNYLVNARRQQGKMKVGCVSLQHIWGHHGIAELASDCASTRWSFPATIQRPRIAHFCGRKPYLYDSGAYSRPFTIARLAHARARCGWLAAWLVLWGQDFRVLCRKCRRRVGRAT